MPSNYAGPSIEPPALARQAFGKLAAVSVGCAVVLAGLGWIPTARLVGEGGVWSLLAGIGTGLAAGLLGAVLTSRAVLQGGFEAPKWILLGTAVRFLAVLMLVVPITFSGMVERKAYVVWVAVTYLVLLLVDTLMAVPRLRGPGLRHLGPVGSGEGRP